MKSLVFISLLFFTSTSLAGHWSSSIPIMQGKSYGNMNCVYYQNDTGPNRFVSMQSFHNISFLGFKSCNRNSMNMNQARHSVMGRELSGTLNYEFKFLRHDYNLFNKNFFLWQRKWQVEGYGNSKYNRTY